MENKPNCINCGAYLQHNKGSRFCDATCMIEFQERSSSKKIK